MRKLLLRVFLVLFGILIFIKLPSQPAGDNAHIPKVIPESPNAAAIDKFGIIPVGYATGIPSISYPFWSWQRGKLNVNLNLSYHAGGHKVDDLAPNTGLGWALSGTPRISRTIRGVHDDHVTRGYMYTAALPFLVTGNYDEDYYNHPSARAGTPYFDPNIAISAYNSTYHDNLKLINDGWLDAEQDIFSYAINGKSGRFVISKQKVIVPLEHTALKFEMDYTGLNGSIVSFTITDDNGLIYLFDLTEKQETENITTSLSIPGAFTDQNYSSGWLLTKCTDPGTGDEIIYHYSNTNTGIVKYDIGWSESQIFDITKIDHLVGIPRIIPAFAISNAVSNYTRITLTEQNIQSISLPDGSIILFTYGFDRDDLFHSRALTLITVKNMRDDVIKKYQLNYDYFLANGITPNISEVTGNDISKRLKLESIDEISSDGLENKRTTYEYNTTKLNVRGSNAQDQWGYNKNPIINNSSRLPVIKFEEKELLLQQSLGAEAYGPYLSGADRAPDENFVKAAILEKVIYPTGGSTRFSYQCNRAFSETDYYIDRAQTNTVNWQASQFGYSRTLTFNNRDNANIEFKFKVVEDNARGTHPPGCLYEIQDNKIVTFEIRSFDGSFVTTVEEPYYRFLLGHPITVSVPLSFSSLRVKCIYDITETCAFMWPFTSEATAEYIVPKHDKLVGGVRVDSIINIDGVGNEIATTYNYDGSDGNSSAVLSEIPDYSYYRTTQYHFVNGSTDVYELWTKHLNRNSSPTSTLNYFGGGPLIYKRVKEILANGSHTERQYKSLAIALGHLKPPFTPSQDLQNLSGLLEKEIIKDASGVVKLEKTVVYNSVNELLTGTDNLSLKTSVIATLDADYRTLTVVDTYRPRVTRAEVEHEETKTFENGNVITVRKDMTYDADKYYLKTVKTKDSKGLEKVQSFYYPFDQVGIAFTHMVQNNILSVPVLTSLVKLPLVVNDPFVVQTRTNYDLWNNGALSSPSSIEISNRLNDPFYAAVTYDAYDQKGNIRQYTAKDGVVTTFIWGYKHQYLVAKIVGKTYSNVITQSGINLSVVDNPASEAALKTELDKLRSVTGTLVNTYMYKPLVGVISETDPNGKTTYYEYDGFGRLKYLKDQEHNIIKTYNYQFQRPAATN